MKYTKREEELAKEEYLQMIDTLQNSEEFENEWCGEWDDFAKETFGKKGVLAKGDKNKYMKYWIENQKIINDDDWARVEKIEYQDYMDNEFDI